MVKSIFLIFVSVVPFFANARQDSSRYIHKGLLRAQATISPGFMFNEGVTNIYIHGDLEYYVEDNISVRGDSYYYLNTIDDKKPFMVNHSIFFGAVYHFPTASSLDPYIGIQPGIAYSKANTQLLIYEYSAKLYLNRATANPLISSVAGVNYYASKIFHLFMSVRYVSGKHLSDAPSPLSLNEVKISFGLGWNIR